VRRKKTEFFEAFRSPETSSAPARPTRPSAPVARRTPRAPEATPPFGGPRPPAVALTRDKVAAIAVAVAVAVVGAFLLGLVVGGRRTTAPGQPAPPPAAKAPTPETPIRTGAPETPVAPSSPKATAPKSVFKLRIISGVTYESALKLRDFLQERGFKDIGFKADNGRYTIYVGTFASNTSPEAKALQETFRTMTYEGGTPFASCYFVKHTGP